MNRLHKLLFLSLLLLGCNKGHKAGMFPVGDLVQKGVPSPAQSFVLAKQMFFTASGGHLVSFTQEDGIWVATVDKKLPTGFSSRVKLPVHFAQEFSVERLANYSPKEQQSLTHIERTSAGQDIVYVGRVGLQGGGAVLSYEAQKYEYRISGGVLGFITEYHKCLQCGYRREGDTEAVKNSMRFHHCNKCANCLVKYKCSYSCTRICKECCGCSERIAAEKEREKKRREKEEKEERAAAERRRREEESRNSSYYSYTPSYSYHTPSSSTQDSQAERKRKEEEAISQKLAEAMRQASLGGMTTMSNINIDVSGNTRTSNTSTVTRKQ